jgi:hypothetical protein
MWQNVCEDQVWIMDNFLSQEELDHILNEWKLFKDFRVVEQKQEEYLIAPTYYHSKQPKRPPRSRKQIQKFVIEKLNTLYVDVFGKTADTDNLTHAQFYFKENEPNISRFDLHIEPGPEDDDRFGECVFMLYLSDEDDGPLICPSEKDAQEFITDTYKQSVAKMNIKYVEKTQSILPRKNRCVVVRNGTPHYVPVSTGVRKCVTGWSFIPRKLKNVS